MRYLLEITEKFYKITTTREQLDLRNRENVDIRETIRPPRAANQHYGTCN